MSKSNSKVTRDKEKVPITFNKEQLRLIEKYGGMMGNTKAEVIRNIVINWIIKKEEEK